MNQKKQKEFMILVIICYHGHILLFGLFWALEGPLKDPSRALILNISIFHLLFLNIFQMTPKPSFFSNPFGNDDGNKVNNYFPISTIGKGVKISKLTKILQLKIFRDGFPAFSTQFWGGMTKNWTMVCSYMYILFITNRV